MNAPIILGITGASGAIYAVRMLEVLRAADRDVHLTISPSGRDVLQHELKLNIDLANFTDQHIGVSGSKSLEQRGKLHYFHHNNFMAPMASGSFITAGMVVCPCSGTT